MKRPSTPTATGCNGGFGNPTNGDIGLAAITHDPGNCFSGDTDASATAGPSTDPAGIETNPANYTKFLSLAPDPAPPIAGAKTSVVFTTQNVPGALYQALGAFATRSINLTKLESRPRRQVPWEYVFYADFEGHQNDPPIQAALHDLSRITTFLRILGSYPKSPTPLP